MLILIILYAICTLAFGVTLLLIVRRVRKANETFIKNGVKINAIGLYTLDYKWVKDLYTKYDKTGGSVMIKKINILSIIGGLGVFFMLIASAITGEL